jgi:hypothetical protein
MSLLGSFRTANAWAVAAAVGLLFAIGLAAAPVATADMCDNALLRAQTGSAGLPDCRAYEMVTPPYKEGFPAVEPKFGDDGVVAYQSAGSFAGNTNGVLLGMSYIATRSSAGWITTAPGPPEAIYDTHTGGRFPGPAELGRSGGSVDLRRTLWTMHRRDVPGDPFGFWLREPDGVFTRIGDASIAGPQPGVQGVSDDLTHIVFNYGSAGSAAVTALREYVGTGNSGPPRMVSTDNSGQPSPLETCPDGVSVDGRVIVFSLAAGCGGDVRQQVWARVAGSATVAVSGSECTRTASDLGGLCNGVSAAKFVGMADDGSRVFFTTRQQLVNGDTDTGNDLYACDIPAGVPAPVGSANPCATLRQVSGTAANAQVENVVAVSEDGSRVYFVAQGVLASNPGAGDVPPATGADAHNLYLWERDGAHPAGQTRFVARLASNDTTNDTTRAQMTPDGRYLLFVTANSLVTEGPSADTDGVRDPYRYDASTGVMVRVSTSVAGGGGDDPDFAAGLARRSSMTADGSTVIFGTGEALSQDDTNGGGDVYSWRDGQVSLISQGSGADGSPVGITPSGRDIFFETNEPVLPADRDLIGDYYTARVGGGFTPRSLAACSGDGCQGLWSDAPGLAGPRSGLSGGSDPVDVGVVLSLRAVTATQRRRLAATGKLTLTVKANKAGRVAATARAKIDGRSVAVGSGRQTMTTPGSVAVKLKLSRNAQSRLAARGRLTVKVSVSHSKATKGRSVTLKLTRARATKSSVGGRS